MNVPIFFLLSTSLAYCHWTIEEVEWLPFQKIAKVHFNIILAYGHPTIEEVEWLPFQKIAKVHFDIILAYGHPTIEEVAWLPFQKDKMAVMQKERMKERKGKVKSKNKKFLLLTNFPCIVFNQ